MKFVLEVNVHVYIHNEDNALLQKIHDLGNRVDAVTNNLKDELPKTTIEKEGENK